MADFIIKNGRRLELVEANPGKDQTTYAAEQLPTPAEREVQVEASKEQAAQAMADRLMDGDGSDVVLGYILFQVIKAQKSGDWSYFSEVETAQDYRDFIKTLIRSRM